MFYSVYVNVANELCCFDFHYLDKVIKFCLILPDSYKVYVVDICDNSLDVTESIKKEVGYVKNQKN